MVSLPTSEVSNLWSILSPFYFICGKGKAPEQKSQSTKPNCIFLIKIITNDTRMFFSQLSPFRQIKQAPFEQATYVTA